MRMTLGLALGLLFSVFGLFHYGHASAAVPLSPDPGSTIPSGIRNYLIGCDSGSLSPAFGTWVSPAGDPSSTSTTVPAGSTSVGLQYNFDGAYCKSNSKSVETRTKITAVSSGVTANSGGMLAGNVVGLSWGDGTGSAGIYRESNFPFKYSPPGGFSSGTNTYTVTLTFATINHFNNGSYTCVANENGGANDAGGGFNYGSCAQYSRTFSVSVTYTPAVAANNPPSGTMALNCSAGTVSGTESDPDRPNDGARVVITVYGAGGVGVNGASSSWSYSIPAAYKDGANHVINGTARNVDGSASYAGTDVTLSGSGLTYNSSSCNVSPPPPPPNPSPPPPNPSPPPPPPPPPATTGTGNLSCGASTATSVTINYSYFNTANGTTVYYQDRAVTPISLSTAGQNATPGNQSASYTVPAQAGHSYGFSMQDNTTGAFIVDYNSPVICSANNPIVFTSGGAANPGVNDDEDPTTVTPYATPTTSPASSPPPSLQCTITVTKVTYATSTTSTVTTYGPVACTAGVQITGPITPIPGGGVAGDQICASLNVTPGSGTANSDGSVSSPSGSYNQSPPTCTLIKNKPFFKIFNSSITTGGDVNGPPSTTPGALAGWYNNSAGNGYGASAQLGAYALVNITGFASNQTGSRVPSGLSFANTGLPPGAVGTGSDSPKLGGLLNGTASITAPATVPTSSNSGGGGAVNFNTLVNGGSNSQPGAYRYGSTASPVDLVLKNPANQPVSPNQNRGIYVVGNLYISNNLYYDQAGWALGSLPSLVVVVTGNIYIDKNVTKLDGTYEALGSIYTCAENNTFSAITTGNLYAKCNQQLTVTGSFVAKKVNLLRTFGSLRDEKGSPSSSCSNAGSLLSAVYNTTCAAEVFEFSPEQYLQKPAAKSSGGTVKYDAITSLPPVL
jgi:hypothetical protein